MRTCQQPRVFIALVFLFFPCYAACGETQPPPSVLRERYYHHKVVLDESRHDDEFFTFVTRPDIYAPRWSIDVYSEEVSPGYWFVAPYEEAIQADSSPPWNAPHIYDSEGELIWSGAPIFNGYTTFDFRVINMLGKPMLSMIAPHEVSSPVQHKFHHQDKRR